MTSAVITPETKDTPSLTVAITQLSSSSPFPSPGSPFFPPPIPSAHEYALVAPVSKHRSTDSRMNVGSKTDHESMPSTPHNPVVATAAGKTSSTIDHKRRENADIVANGSSSGNNGLAASVFHALETGKPDSKANLNGQTTPLLIGAGAEESPMANQTLSEDANSSTRSTPLDDDACADGTSNSPSTPSASSPSSHNPAADPRYSITPATTPSLSPISTTTTTTEDATKPSPNNNSKSPSRSSSLRASRDSLTSSRPAPLSPVDSRRASKVLSRHSSTSTRSSRSRPGSISSLTPANSTHNPELASPTTPTPIQVQQQQQQPQQQQQQQNTVRRTPSAVAAPPLPILVKIRDFAFPDEDVRHTGTGPLTPRPNRRLQRPLSTWSASSTSSAGSEDYRDDGPGASGGASFGFSGWGLGRLGWFGARSSVGSAGGTSANPGHGPSQGDFARNFTDVTSPDYEIEDPYDSLDEDDDVEVDDGVDAGEREREHPLLPGLYRAMYAFEPEGTAEMALEEDQIVRVIGRGGGVGWAIVARGGDEGHALVPEGYLEFVSLDQDQVGEEEEG